MDALLHTRPLYLQIHDVLSARISAGAWQAHTPLPNEFELAKEFGVSLGTLRKAIDVLVSDGILDRRQGRGTFIVDRTSSEFERKYRRIHRADGAPIDWHIQVLAIETDTPTASEREYLALERADDEVIRVERLRRAESGAVAHDRISLAAPRLPGAAQLFAANPGIIRLAHACHVLLGRCRETITMEPANQNWSDLFTIPLATTLMKLDRVAYDTGGSPLEWRIAHCHLRDMIYLSE